MKGSEPAREVFSGRGGPIGNRCGSLGQRDNSKSSYNDSIIIHFNMESGAGFWCCPCSHHVTSVVHAMLKQVGNT